MEYFGRELGKLGFGCMRLPGIGEPDGIDIEQVKQMVDAFMDAGFNYFDTAWAYAGSEQALRETLVERYPRDSYFITTKFAPWIKCETREDMERQFEESLADLGLDYVDMLLVHNVGSPRTAAMRKFDAWQFVVEQKEKGRTKHIGFSTHGVPDEIAEYYNEAPGCEMIQLQINYADWFNPAYPERDCYEVVRDLDIPIVVMEPVKGGALANPPANVRKLMDEAAPGSSYASWAIRFAAGLDGVMTVLSGMSTIDQMKDNLSYMRDFQPLDSSEMQVIRQAREIIGASRDIPCTSCRYCMQGCPQGIAIPGIFAAMNLRLVEGRIEEARTAYAEAVAAGSPASACISCGQCEKACPQRIGVIEQLRSCAAEFER